MSSPYLFNYFYVCTSFSSQWNFERQRSAFMNVIDVSTIKFYLLQIAPVVKSGFWQSPPLGFFDSGLIAFKFIEKIVECIYCKDKKNTDLTNLLTFDWMLQKFVLSWVCNESFQTICFLREILNEFLIIYYLNVASLVYSDICVFRILWVE